MCKFFNQQISGIKPFFVYLGESEWIEWVACRQWVTFSTLWWVSERTDVSVFTFKPPHKQINARDFDLFREISKSLFTRWGFFTVSLFIFIPENLYFFRFKRASRALSVRKSDLSACVVLCDVYVCIYVYTWCLKENGMGWVKGWVIGSQFEGSWLWPQ